MSKIVWDQIGERTYHTGADRAVLYPQIGTEFATGVAWNGLTSIESSPAGHEITELFRGDVPVSYVATEAYASGTINAYTYPDEFEPMIGSEEAVPGIYIQHRSSRPNFGFTYRTKIGNDVEGTEYGYKLHLIYGAYVTGVSTTFNTISDSPEAAEFGWEFSTNPLESSDYGQYSEVIIDSLLFSKEFMKRLEEILYGTEESDPRLPLLDELVQVFYETEPVPEEWQDYPYDTRYPSNYVYPHTPEPVEP